MLTTTSSDYLLKSESTSTIENIVLKSLRAHIIKSNGDGFGSFIERLVNVAYETHCSFSNLIKTLNDLINYIQKELEKSYQQYQFSIIIGKNFDCNDILSNYFALIEHGGMKILIFSSIGCSYKSITTTTNDIDDDNKPLSW